MKEKRVNKKPLLAIGLLLLVGVVGTTLAVFTNTVDIPNLFKAATYHTEVEENFKSPEDWLPGTTTPKTVIARNTGDVEVAVRVSYEESWKSQNGATLPLAQNQSGTNVTAAVINFSNVDNGHWILKEENGKKYYYYYKKLAKDGVTDSFIESVTFNEKILPDLTCNKTTVGNKTTETCNSSGNGYDGATYTLNINVEFVQFDQYKTYWKTTAEIS